MAAHDCDDDSRTSTTAKAPSMFSGPAFIIFVITAGILSDHFISGMVAPLLPVILQERAIATQESIPVAVAKLNSISSLSTLVASPILGVFASWLHCNNALYFLGLLGLSGSSATIIFGDSMAILGLGRVMQGLSGAVLWVVGLGMVCDCVQPDRVGLVVGQIFSSAGLFSLVAPACGGLLYQYTGIVGVGALIAFILAVDLLLRFVTLARKNDGGQQDHSPGQEQTDEPSSTSAPVTEQTPLLEQNNSRPSLRILLGFLGTTPVIYGLLSELVNGLHLSALYTSAAVRARQVLGLGAAETGFLFLCIGICSCAAGAIGGWAVNKYGAVRVAMVAYAMVSVVVIVQGESPPSSAVLYTITASLYAAATVLNFSVGIVLCVNQLKTSQKSSPGLLGSDMPTMALFGFCHLAFEGGRALGPILSETLISTLGFQTRCLIFGGATLIVSASFVVLSDDISRLFSSTGRSE